MLLLDDTFKVTASLVADVRCTSSLLLALDRCSTVSTGTCTAPRYLCYCCLLERRKGTEQECSQLSADVHRTTKAYYDEEKKKTVTVIFRLEDDALLYLSTNTAEQQEQS